MSKVFADNLKAYRTMAHMTQSDLAAAADITRSAVNNYEAAKSEPSFDVLCKFSEVLGVELTDLITKHESFPTFVRKVQLTDAESALIQAYREADAVYQQVALEILKTHRRVR